MLAHLPYVVTLRGQRVREVHDSNTAGEIGRAHV